MRIEYLADHPHHLNKVANWQHTQFGYLNPSITLEQRIERVGKSMQKEQLPLALVALSEQDGLLGSAAILATTITHPHLSPWLSAVYVPPEGRNMGIASALSLRAHVEAKRLGFDQLYLFTPHNESLYSRIGWNTFERSQLNGLPIAIMARSTVMPPNRVGNGF